MDILKEQMQDFLLRLHFVNNSPSVAGALITAWNHGMRFPTNRVTYYEQFADLCECIGLPRELPKPEYPKEIWAAFKEKHGTKYAEFDPIFEGHIGAVSDWCKKNKGNYHHMGTTGRYLQTEQEMFEKWKAKVLESNHG